MSQQQYQVEVMDELRMQEETIEVCQYFGDERGDKFACCGEVHFLTMSLEAWQRGDEIK